MKSFNKKESGFTLIELLVVVAIIGLLSSIVLVSLEDTRSKAKNSAKNQLVLEYTKALELYRSDNTSYPQTTVETYYCLGESDGVDVCQYTRDGSSFLISELSEYIPGVPNDDTPVIPLGVDRDYKGITYSCIDSNCSDYALRWYLIGTSQNCIDDSEITSNFGGNTICDFDTQ